MSEGPRIVLNITRIIIVALGLSGLAPAVTFAADKVPPGNRNAEQPAIPGASVRRTKAGKTSFDLKYEKVRDLMRTDSALVGKIKKTASAYGIAPIHMVGAIVGEHTYNVDAYDSLQSYYVKAASYAGNSFRFGYLPNATAIRIPIVSGPAGKMSGRIASAGSPWAVHPIPTTASAPSSSSPSMRAKHSVWVRSIR
jgi:hypothetical protein